MKKCLFLYLFLLQVAVCVNAGAAVNIGKDEDIYKIDNVKIENISDDLVAGKQKAVEEGKKAAFASLIRRFINYGYIEKSPNFTFAQIDDSIKKMVVVEELITDNKFEARMNYEFEPQKVMTLLGIKDAGILPIRESYLIVPVLTDKDKVVPWQPNWLDAWRHNKVDSITIPLGDLEDMKSVNSADLSKFNYSGFDVLARRYKIPVIVMADANFDVGKNLLTVTLKRFEVSPKKIAEYKYPGSFGIGSKELFVTAANDIMAIIKEDGIPNEGTALELDLSAQDMEIEYVRDYQSEERRGQNNLAASVVTRSLSDWSALRRKLISCKLINNISVTSFSATNTEINLYYVGEVDELQRSLVAIGLDLTKQGDAYIIDRVQ